MSLRTVDGMTPKLEGKIEKVLLGAMEQIDWNQIELPPLSPMADQLVGICGSTQLSMEHIEILVEAEPAFAAKVMTHANSLTEFPPAVTLKQAIRRLDKVVIVKLIAEVASNNFGQRFPEIVRHLMRKLWTHLIFSAHAARELAGWTNKVDPEEAFVSAMFSNIAVPVVICAITRHTHGDPAMLGYASPITQFVNNQQRALSRHILESWQFAGRVVDFPERLAVPESDNMAAIVGLANESAMAYGYTYGGLQARPEKLKQYLHILSLNQSTVNTLSEVIGPSLNAALSIVRTI